MNSILGRLFTKEKYTLRIETSSICNQRCLICPQNRYKYRNNIMLTETYTKIIDSIHDMQIPISFINFSGMCEPLTDPLLIQRAEYGKKITNRIETYTNGKLLTGNLLNDINRTFTRVYFSIHGNTPKEYEHYTGNNFNDMKLVFQNAKQVLGDKLILSNMPEGRLHTALGAGLITPADIHPIHNWADPELASFLKVHDIPTSMNGQKYCELGKFIIFDIFANLRSCCIDWNGENLPLSNTFPKCKDCINYTYPRHLTESGKLAKFQLLLKELNRRLWLP